MALLLTAGACAGDPPVDDAAAEPGAAAEPAEPDAIARLPVNEGFDYQLGGAYNPGVGAALVVRDRTAAPDSGRSNICYVNGFQTQPDDSPMWLADHPELVLRDATGQPVVDPDWPDEYVLDVGSETKRDALVDIVGRWFDGCAAHGFVGVEIDNLDTFTRFPDLLAAQDAVAYASALVERAHAVGLLVAQKNTAELAPQRREIGFDFAIVEECNEFDECDVFTAAFGRLVYLVEYDAAAFEAGCERYPELSIVLRDRELVGPNQPGYHRRWC